MKLFTKEIDKKLFQQYPYGSDLASQQVVAKIFNPYGRGTWYLLNSDPSDPDYLWAIVDLFEVEIGSVSRTELESIKVKPFGLGLERDLYFSPVNAMELYEGLQSGKRYANGGISDVEVIEKNNEAYLGMPQIGKGSTMVKLEHGGNLDMLKNQAVQFKHHAEELHNVLKSNPNVDAWVVAKAERASTDLSDITHYLEGTEKMAKGGQLSIFDSGGRVKYNEKGEAFGYEEDDSVYEIHYKEENKDKPYMIWDKMDGVYVASFPYRQRAVEYIENKSLGYGDGGKVNKIDFETFIKNTTLSYPRVGYDKDGEVLVDIKLRSKKDSPFFYKYDAKSVRLDKFVKDRNLLMPVQIKSKIFETAKYSFADGGNILSEDTVARVDDPAFADVSMYSNGGYIDEEKYYLVVSETKDGYWTIMSKPNWNLDMTIFTKNLLTVPRGETLKVVNLLEAKNHKKVIGEKYLEEDNIIINKSDFKFAEGGELDEVKVIYISDDEKLKYLIEKEEIEKLRLAKDRIERRNKLIEDTLKTTYKGELYQSIGYNALGKGHALTLDEAKKSVKILSRIYPNFSFIIKESIGNYYEKDITKKTFLVMSNMLIGEQQLANLKSRGVKFAEGGQISNGSLVRVKKYGWIMRVDKIEGNMYYLENDRRGTMNGNAGSYLASDIELVMSEGGEVSMSEKQKNTLYDSWVNAKNKLVDLQEDLKKAKSRNDKDDITEIIKSIKRTKLYISSFEKKMNENDIEYAKGGKLDVWETIQGEIVQEVSKFNEIETILLYSGHFVEVKDNKIIGSDYLKVPNYVVDKINKDLNRNIKYDEGQYYAKGGRVGEFIALTLNNGNDYAIVEKLSKVGDAKIVWLMNLSKVSKHKVGDIINLRFEGDDYYSDWKKFDNNLTFKNFATEKQKKDFYELRDKYAKGGIIGSSPTIEGINKLIGEYYYSPNIKLEKNTENSWNVLNSKGVINSVEVIEKKGKFYFKEKDKKYAKGGKTTFKDKVASIKSKLLKNKKVPKAVQKDYGKTFSPAETEDSAKRIAGSQRKKEMAKK